MVDDKRRRHFFASFHTLSFRVNSIFWLLLVFLPLSGVCKCVFSLIFQMMAVECWNDFLLDHRLDRLSFLLSNNFGFSKIYHVTKCRTIHKCKTKHLYIDRFEHNTHSLFLFTPLHFRKKSNTTAIEIKDVSDPSECYLSSSIRGFHHWQSIGINW